MQSRLAMADLAISLAIASSRSRRWDCFGTLSDLISWSEEARATGRFQQRLNKLTRAALVALRAVGVNQAQVREKS